MSMDNKVISKALMREEIAYFLITSRESQTHKQIKCPLEAIFVVESKKFAKNIADPSPGKENAPTCLSIEGQTAKVIATRLLKLLPEITAEKAFLIDQNLPLTIKNRLALYHLLCRKFKYVYFLDSLFERRNGSAEFTEIFPDESIIMLFEKVPELKDIPWDEPLKNNRISPDFHTMKR
jgi:hypothetical protein